MLELLHFLNEPSIRGFALGGLVGGLSCMAWMWLRPVPRDKRRKL